MRMLAPDVRSIGNEEIAPDELVIATTWNELSLLAGALNEALEAVEEWEFATRLGVTPDQARVLYERIDDVLRMASPVEWSSE